jgi:DNA invertase Pin-like site-specific DNA recombinase
MAVIIYTRVSTSKQGVSGLGAAAQEKACRAWAESQGLEVAAVFADQISGSVPACERSGFINAVAQLNKGDALVMYDRARLGRGTMIANAIATQLINKAGAQLVTLDIPSEAEEAEMMLFQNLLDAFAAYERAKAAKRTARALAVKREKGLRLGPPPKGMKADSEGKLVADEAEQEAVARVREMKAAGLTIVEVTAQAALEGITTRRGTAPSRATCALWCKGIKAPQAERKPKPKRKGKAAGGRPVRVVVGLAETCLDLRERGLSYTAIAAEVSKRGFTTSKGKPLQATQVARILARVSSVAQ